MKFEHIEDLSIRWLSYKKKYEGSITLKQDPGSKNSMEIAFGVDECQQIWYLIEDMAIAKMERVLEGMKEERNARVRDVWIQTLEE